MLVFVLANTVLDCVSLLCNLLVYCAILCMYFVVFFYYSASLYFIFYGWKTDTLFYIVPFYMDQERKRERGGESGENISYVSYMAACK